MNTGSDLRSDVPVNATIPSAAWPQTSPGQTVATRLDQCWKSYALKGLGGKPETSRLLLVRAARARILMAEAPAMRTRNRPDAPRPMSALHGRTMTVRLKRRMSPWKGRGGC